MNTPKLSLWNSILFNLKIEIQIILIIIMHIMDEEMDKTFVLPGYY